MNMANSVSQKEATMIVQLLKELEKEKGIKILFAIENGSRAWRMHSKDSDYDVRFVFAHPLKEYLQIRSPQDVIERAFDKEGKSHTIEGSFIDMVGFDVFKFLRLLASSNPTTIEWLTTDIVYYGEQNTVFKKFATKQFNPLALYHHYKSMCKNNYLKYLKSGTEVTCKKYLYSYRGLINAKWVVHKKTVPPIIFNEAVEGMENVLPSEIISRIQELIADKAKGKEKDQIANIIEMDAYIEEFLKDDSEVVKEQKHANLTILNDELSKMLMEKVS